MAMWQTEERQGNGQTGVPKNGLTVPIHYEHSARADWCA